MESSIGRHSLTQLPGHLSPAKHLTKVVTARALNAPGIHLNSSVVASRLLHASPKARLGLLPSGAANPTSCGPSPSAASDRPAIVTPQSCQSCPLFFKAELTRNCLIAVCFTTNCKAFHWALSCSPIISRGDFALHSLPRRSHSL
jgi:hypothetical protein